LLLLLNFAIEYVIEEKINQERLKLRGAYLFLSYADVLICWTKVFLVD